jgi:hypothetical protein
MLNLLLTLMCKINEGEWDKYHMYDTIPSYLLVVFRILSVLVFMAGIVMLYLKTYKHLQIMRFLASFSLLGAVHFLSLPAIMVLANLLPPPSRKQIVFFSVELIKNSTNLLVTWMMASRSSQYSRVKQSGQSFFQENNKLL